MKESKENKELYHENRKEKITRNRRRQKKLNKKMLLAM